MIRHLSARIERWPVRGSFTIARGAKTHVDVVVAEIVGDGAVGRGEGTAIYYHGETAETVLAAVLAQADAIAGGLTREELQERMPRGAARNALDCALWDWDAKHRGQPVWALAGLGAPRPLETAFTISLADPARMEADARAASELPLLKLKLAGEGDEARVAAVRLGAPNARLIVDANEAWNGRKIRAAADILHGLGVELIEQPVRAGDEELLVGIDCPVPLCADESCQDRADLEKISGRFQAINIKLDKCGGLTEAVALARTAPDYGLSVMIGCMLGTSLAMAPAALLASCPAKWIDLDGALLLQQDRSDGMPLESGRLVPPTIRLWG